MVGIDIKAYTDFWLTISLHPTYVIEMYLGLGGLRAHVLDIDVLLFLGNTLYMDYRINNGYSRGPDACVLEYASTLKVDYELS